MNLIITGAAGFIGSRVAEVMAEDGVDVLGIDNLNSYYDPGLKLLRLHRGGFDVIKDQIEDDICNADSLTFREIRVGEILRSRRLSNLRFVKMDIADAAMEQIICDESPDVILHLAAQPGVRYSMRNAKECVESNVMLFLNMLEHCKNFGVKRFLYASSSSVYGNPHPHSFKETDPVEAPISVYAVTKRTNEMLAHVYSRMYGFRAMGMRFFSVYGEWGRPDMAPMLFANAILRGEPISLFNGGMLSRDFTYIEDVAQSIRRIINGDNALTSASPYHEVINIGRGVPTQLHDFVKILEDNLRSKAKVRLLPMQPGEAQATMCDPTKLRMRYGYAPSTDVETGLGRFASWITDYAHLLRPFASGNNAKDEFESKFRFTPDIEKLGVNPN